MKRSAWRYLWSAQDIRRKLLITLLILAIYRLAAHVPVPGANADVIRRSWLRLAAPVVRWSACWICSRVVRYRISPFWQWVFIHTSLRRLSCSCWCPSSRLCRSGWKKIRAKARSGWKSGPISWRSLWRLCRPLARSTSSIRWPIGGLGLIINNFGCSGQAGLSSLGNCDQYDGRYDVRHLVG